MGRAEDRKRAKNIKKKLSSDQFNKLSNNIREEIITFEVKQRFGIITKIMTDVIVDVMRANRISEQRVAKINQEIWEEIVRRYPDEKKVSKC